MVFIDYDSQAIENLCSAPIKELPTDRFQITKLSQPQHAEDLKAVRQMVKDLAVHENCVQMGYKSVSEIPNSAQVQELIDENESTVWLTHEQMAYDILRVNSSGQKIRHFLDDKFMHQNNFDVWTVKDKHKNNQVIGFVSSVLQYCTKCKGNKIYLEDFYLKSSYRKHGLGFILFQLVPKYGKQHQAKHAYGCSHRFNTDSFAFYQQTGGVDRTNSENICVYSCSLDSNRQEHYERYNKLMFN